MISTRLFATSGRTLELREVLATLISVALSIYSCLNVSRNVSVSRLASSYPSVITLG